MIVFVVEFVRVVMVKGVVLVLEAMRIVMVVRIVFGCGGCECCCGWGGCECCTGVNGGCEGCVGCLFLWRSLELWLLWQL